MAFLYNPMKEDFVFHWDKTPYLVPAGQRVQLADHLVRHGAKHLVDYIILHSDNWANVCPERTSKNLSAEREPIMKVVLFGNKLKEVGKIEEETEDVENLEQLEDEASEESDEEPNEEVKIKKKPGRPRKIKVEEEKKEFEDLENI